MKTIIAPVDFSVTSANAIAFAAELAKRSAADLLVVHVLPKGANEDAATDKLKTLESGLKKSYGSELKCETAVVRGNLVAAVREMIAARQPDLLVMGTKGATGLKRILIGSNTVNVIAKTKFPVLIIPEAARFENFNRKGKSKIVLATDLDLLKNEHSLDILKEIALMLVEPKVRVLSVRPKSANLTMLKRMVRDQLVSFFNPEIESERITVFSGNVMDGIDFYLGKNKDAGLVAMIARDSGFLIQRHFTRQMASHTQLPLLVLHDDKPKTT